MDFVARGRDDVLTRSIRTARPSVPKGEYEYITTGHGRARDALPVLPHGFRGAGRRTGPLAAGRQGMHALPRRDGVPSGAGDLQNGARCQGGLAYAGLSVLSRTQRGACDEPEGIVDAAAGGRGFQSAGRDRTRDTGADLHHLSPKWSTHALGWQRASTQRPRVHVMPRDPHPWRSCAQQGQSARSLLYLPYGAARAISPAVDPPGGIARAAPYGRRSEEHTSELQ